MVIKDERKHDRDIIPQAQGNHYICQKTDRVAERSHCRSKRAKAGDCDMDNVELVFFFLFKIFAYLTFSEIKFMLFKMLFHQFEHVGLQFDMVDVQLSM